MPRWLAASAVALAIALMPEVAAAQASRPLDTSPQTLLERIDLDADGKVSKREAARLPSVAIHWKALDQNNDGWLSRDEFIANFRA